MKLLKGACVSTRSVNRYLLKLLGQKCGFFYEIAHYLVALTKTKRNSVQDITNIQSTIHNI